MQEDKMLLHCGTCLKTFNRDSESWSECLRCGAVQCSACEQEDKICPFCHTILKEREQIVKDVIRIMRSNTKSKPSNITDEIKQMKFDF